MTELNNEPTLVVWQTGDKYWYLNEELHREDGPAIEYADGTKWWFLNGNLHREDGPAVEYASGAKEWWLNGEEVTEEEHNKRTSDKPKEVINKYHRNDLIRSIEDMHPNCHPSQTGVLKSALTSVLISVEVNDPALFQEIMQFEMRSQKRMKAMEELAEADVEAGLI